MDRRSKFLAVTLTFFVAAALLPTTADAAAACRANPAVAARSGAHWYYQTNRLTGQKCWFAGARETAVSEATWQLSFDSADQNRIAEPATAAGCIVRPSGRIPAGRHWHYQKDQTTGQKCWRLTDRISRNVRAARSELPASAQPAASDDILRKLSQSTVNAEASVRENLQDLPDQPGAPDQTARPALQVVERAAGQDPIAATFDSRWPNTLDAIGFGDNQTSRPGNPVMDKPAALDAGKASFKQAGRVLTGGPPLGDIVVVFVTSVGSVLILLGLLDWSFLVRGPAAPAQAYPPPLRLPDLESASDPAGINREDGLASNIYRNRPDLGSLGAAVPAVGDLGEFSRFSLETV